MRKINLLIRLLPILFLIYLLSPLLPIKKFDTTNSRDYILGHSPQTTSYGNFLIDEGLVIYNNDTLKKYTELILEGNSPYENCNKSNYDCITTDYILKGIVVSKQEISGEIYYVFNVKKWYYTTYIFRFLNMSYLHSISLLIALILISLFVPPFIKKKMIKHEKNQ